MTADEWTLVGLAGLLGLVIGSFLNVVVHRLPRGQSLWGPRSRCPACDRAIPALENVPLLSYLALRGRCGGCGARISPRYPAIEALTGALFAALAWRHGASPETALWLTFAALLVAAAAVDLEHRIIPDELSLGGLGLGLLGMPLVRAAADVPLASAFAMSAAGGLLGGGLLWTVGFAHARLSVALGRRFEHWPGEGEPHPRPGSLDYWTWFPGMGFGDVKLLAMIGAFVGPSGVVAAIVLASVLGLLFGVVWAAGRGHWNAPFGFGPALAAGALVVALAPRGWLLPGLG